MEGPGLLVGREALAGISPKSFSNLNLGILGHVDSGKTSLCQALTQVQSTACLDKSPQSKERGITLDLGFSALYARPPAAWPSKAQLLQLTLVDCPGHASLIRTVVGGAQIIDAVLLVIDINKGIQTQTAECLAVAELLVPQLIVVLNKCDLLPQEGRQTAISKRSQALRKVMAKTKFGEKVRMVTFSATEKDPAVSIAQTELLVKTVLQSIGPVRRDRVGPLMIMADHCFVIKGKGTVLTGTVLQGLVRTGDEVELPELGQKRKVKSLQVFHKEVEEAGQGDRVALLVANLEGEKPQRTMLCTPGALGLMKTVVIELRKVSYFKFPIRSKAKFHINCGHLTVMGDIRLFQAALDERGQKALERGCRVLGVAEERKEDWSGLDPGVEYQGVQEWQQWDRSKHLFARIQFQKPVVGCLGSMLIGAKLDLDEAANHCRLAFWGRVLRIQDGHGLKIYRWKTKQGLIDRVVDERTVIVKDLFPKEADLAFMVRQKLTTLVGQELQVVGTFGKGNKLKCMGPGAAAAQAGSAVSYRFKKYYK